MMRWHFQSDCAEPGGAKAAYGSAQQGLRQRRQGATGQQDGHAKGLCSTQFDEVVIWHHELIMRCV